MELKKRILVGDVIVISVILLISAIIAGVRFWESESGSVVFVDINGDERQFDLTNDRTVNLYSCGHSLKMVIKNGEVYVSESDCQDNTCVHMGKISTQGECIVCVPAKIYIKIISEEEADYDYVIG